MPFQKFTVPDEYKLRFEAESNEKTQRALEEYLASQNQALAPEASASPRAPVSALSAFKNSLVDGLSFGQAGNLYGATSAAVQLGIDLAQGRDFDIPAAFRKHRDEYNARAEKLKAMHPYASMAGSFAGGAMLGGAAVKGGITLSRYVPEALRGARGLAARLAATAGDAAAFGALDSAARSKTLADVPDNIQQGAVYGGMAGAGAHGVVAGLGTLGGKIARTVAQLGATPQQRAARAVHDAVARMGPDVVKARMDALGPEAALIDTLGRHGGALARKAANLSPEAREQLQGALYGRRAGQNERLANEIAEAGGIPPGTSLEQLKSSYDKAARPALREAYKKAAAAGHDVDMAIVAPLRGTRTFETALEKAKETELEEFAAAVARGQVPAAMQGRGAPHLQILDQTRRALDNMARPTRKRDKVEPHHRIAADYSHVLGERLDPLIPEYGGARKLAQEGFARQRALDTGSRLGGPTVSQDVLHQARAVGAPYQKELAQGYAARKVEQLSNRQAAPGAYGGLETPAARSAMGIALGKKAGRVKDALARERTFNVSLKDVTGNSTTIPQLAEQNGSLAPLALDAVMNMASGDTMGAVRQSLAALQRMLSRQKGRDIAPHMAEYLLQRSPPPRADFRLPAAEEALKGAVWHPRLSRALAAGALAGN